MNKYYLVNVEFRDVNEKGKVQKIREQFLVFTTGCPEAEAAVVKNLVDEGNSLDYEVKAVKVTTISKVL
jgi:hypothetical protein